MAGQGVPDVRRDDAASRKRRSPIASRAHTQTKTTKILEWVCPECDYFEDAEAEDIEGG